MGRGAVTTLVRDFIGGVQHLLQDRNPPFRRWPEKDVARAINFGLMALHKYLPLVSTRRFATLLAAGSVRQDITSIPAVRIKPQPAAGYEVICLVGVIANMGADGVTPGASIRPPVDRNTKDIFEPGWRSEVGTEVREVMFSKATPTQFDVSPAPIGDRWLEIEVMVMPWPIPPGGEPGSEIYTATGDGSANPLPLADNWVEDLTHYVVAYLLLTGSKATQNAPMAQLHAQAFLSSINAQAQAQSGTNPNLKALPYTEDMKP